MYAYQWFNLYMFWPVKEDPYLGSYSERCEQEYEAVVREAGTDTLTANQLLYTSAFTIAQRIARDFESTFHLIKSTNADGAPIDVQQLIDYSAITLSKPSLILPIRYPSGKKSDIEVDLKHDTDVLYYDIQPTSSTSLDEQGREIKYFGAHLLGLVCFENGITLENGFELPIDTYPFVMPFKNVRVSANHRSGLYN